MRAYSARGTNLRRLRSLGLLLPLAVLLGSGVSAGAENLASPGAVTEARLQLQQGDADGALQTLGDYLQLHPEDGDARFVRGLALAQLHRDGDAIAAFQTLSQDYPKASEPYNNLAVLYARQGRYEAARVALQSALAAQPDNPVLRENLGDVYSALANQAYAQALTRNPENAALQQKTTLLTRLGNTPAPATDAAAGEPAESVPALSAADSTAIRQQLYAWALARSSGDLEQYLHCYAQDFQPADGSRSTWEARQKQEFAQAGATQIRIGDFELSPSGNLVQARFVFDYRSAHQHLRTRKDLALQRIDEHWLITRETPPQ